MYISCIYVFMVLCFWKIIAMESDTVWKRSIWVKISDFFFSCDLENWWMTLKNDRAMSSSVHYFPSHQWIQTYVTVRKHSIWVKIDLKIWQMTLENNRAPLLCYFKLCASFHSHWWIQIGVTVQKHPIRVRIGDFLSRVTLKFHGRASITIEHRSYTIFSFLYHFITICEFKQ